MEEIEVKRYKSVGSRFIFCDGSLNLTTIYQDLDDPQSHYCGTCGRLLKREEVVRNPVPEIKGAKYGFTE